MREIRLAAEQAALGVQDVDAILDPRLRWEFTHRPGRVRAALARALPKRFVGQGDAGAVDAWLTMMPSDAAEALIARDVIAQEPEIDELVPLRAWAASRRRNRGTDAAPRDVPEHVNGSCVTQDADDGANRVPVPRAVGPILVALVANVAAAMEADPACRGWREALAASASDGGSAAPGAIPASVVAAASGPASTLASRPRGEILLGLRALAASGASPACEWDSASIEGAAALVAAIAAWPDPEGPPALARHYADGFLCGGWAAA